MGYIIKKNALKSFQAQKFQNSVLVVDYSNWTKALTNPCLFGIQKNKSPWSIYSLFWESLDCPSLQIPVGHQLLLVKSIRHLLLWLFATWYLIEIQDIIGEERENFPINRFQSNLIPMLTIWSSLMGVSLVEKDIQDYKRGCCCDIRENLEKYLSIWLRLEAISSLFASPLRYKISILHMTMNKKL